MFQKSKIFKKNPKIFKKKIQTNPKKIKANSKKVQKMQGSLMKRGIQQATKNKTIQKNQKLRKARETQSKIKLKQTPFSEATTF